MKQDSLIGSNLSGVQGFLLVVVLWGVIGWLIYHHYARKRDSLNAEFKYKEEYFNTVKAKFDERGASFDHIE